MSRRILIGGHRGAAGYCAENTLESFAMALSMGVDMIELDVFLSKDNQVVVIHDLRVDRTTNGKGYVAEFTAAELAQLQTTNGQSVPTLVEVLQLVDRRCIVAIEIKDPAAVQPVSAVIRQFVADGWKTELFAVLSFNFHILRDFKSLLPEVATAASSASLPLDYAQYAEDIQASYINTDVEIVTKDYVDDAHQRGLKVIVWTVNDSDDLPRLQGFGVDAVITDFPKRISDALILLT